MAWNPLRCSFVSLVKLPTHRERESELTNQAQHDPELFISITHQCLLSSSHTPLIYSCLTSSHTHTQVKLSTVLNCHFYPLSSAVNSKPSFRFKMFNNGPVHQIYHYNICQSQKQPSLIQLFINKQIPSNWVYRLLHMDTHIGTISLIGWYSQFLFCQYRVLQVGLLDN